MGLPRLDRETARALADAGERARALHHDVVDVEHVMLVVLDVVKVPISRGVSFLSIPELRRRVDAVLAARSTRNVYRDGDTSLPLSERLRAALRRAGDLRGLAFFRAVSSAELLSALLADEEIVAITVAATLDATEAGPLLARATALAEQRRQDAVLVEHVLLAAVESEWFARASTPVGLDPRDLARQLEQKLDGYGSGERERSPTLSPAVVGLMRSSAHQASGAGAERMTPEQVVCQAIRSRPDLFRDVSASRAALLRSINGALVREASRPIEPTEEVDVVFHNDDYTTMEFVVSVLKEQFDLSHADAVEVMVRVHRSGEGVAAQLQAVDAAARVDEALLRAEKEGMPLFISLRPIARR